MARALAKSCGTGARKITFFMTKGAELHNKFIGESDRQLIALFKEASARQARRPSAARTPSVVIPTHALKHTLAVPTAVVRHHWAHIPSFS
jgi:SpoVK/Ycf46/Vps4 family AAA+-type ATPase